MKRTLPGLIAGSVVAIFATAVAEAQTPKEFPAWGRLHDAAERLRPEDDPAAAGDLRAVPRQPPRPWLRPGDARSRRVRQAFSGLQVARRFADFVLERIERNPSQYSSFPQCRRTACARACALRTSSGLAPTQLDRNGDCHRCLLVMAHLSGYSMTRVEIGHARHSTAALCKDQCPRRRMGDVVTTAARMVDNAGAAERRAPRSIAASCRCNRSFQCDSTAIQHREEVQVNLRLSCEGS